MGNGSGQGRKPDMNLQAYLKNTPQGAKRVYLDVGVAWDGQYGLNFKLAEGAKIRLKDGTILDADSFYFSITDWRDRRNGGSRVRQQPAGVPGGGQGQNIDWGSVPSGADREDDFDRARRLSEQARSGTGTNSLGSTNTSTEEWNSRPPSRGFQGPDDDIPF